MHANVYRKFAEYNTYFTLPNTFMFFGSLAVLGRRYSPVLRGRTALKYDCVNRLSQFLYHPPRVNPGYANTRHSIGIISQFQSSEINQQSRLDRCFNFYYKILRDFLRKLQKNNAKHFV